jgi:hypothetical protein
MSRLASLTNELYLYIQRCFLQLRCGRRHINIDLTNNDPTKTIHSGQQRHCNQLLALVPDDSTTSLTFAPKTPRGRYLIVPKTSPGSFSFCELQVHLRWTDWLNDFWRQLTHELYKRCNMLCESWSRTTPNVNFKFILTYRSRKWNVKTLCCEHVTECAYHSQLYYDFSPKEMTVKYQSQESLTEVVVERFVSTLNRGYTKVQAIRMGIENPR